MAIQRQNHRSPAEISSSDFKQAHINRAIFCDQVRLHVEKSHNVLVHTHVPEFLVDQFPKLWTAFLLGLSDLVVKFTYNRCTSILLPKARHEVPAILSTLEPREMC